ncbi:condensation domain-containing protein [Actinophytocola oryzae]|uniref:Condensation domain-containing protein n=1 Tax=Actinophytocola oryzae TaxID=502181 RepID=A0A4R7VK06_9PSEU|nr:condensation domain-containing protein [Actinophytocola oryzae]TDV49784.1 condensation domain-containing protein [Actinophytocola oryzae]
MTLLTHGQRSVLRSLVVHGERGRAVANLTAVWEVPPGPDIAQVEDAWLRLVAAHESLRTTFAADGDDLTATVHPFAPAGVGNVEVEDGADPAAQAAAIGAVLAAEPIDIATGPPWRAVLTTELGDPVHLVVAIHHVAVDNEALRLLEPAFLRAVDGDPVAAEVQPADLAAVQSASADSPTLRHWVSVWPDLEPADRDPADPSPRRRASLYSVEALAATRRVCERLRVSVQAVLLAVGAVALGRVEGRDRLSMALMAANRLDPRWAGLVGSLNQYAPVTIDLDGGSHPDEFVAAVYPLCLTAYLNGSYDVDALGAALAEAGIEDPDPTAFAKHFNFLGPVDTEPEEGSALRTGVSWRRSSQRTGPNLHLAIAMGDGLLIGVGASEACLPGDAPAEVAAAIEAGLLSLDRGDAATLAELDLTPLRPV